MRRLLVIALAYSLFGVGQSKSQVVPSQGAPKLCQYGGLINTMWVGGGNGFWQFKKWNNQWTLIDPHGHAVVWLGVYLIQNTGDFSYNIFANKYSASCIWGPYQVRRARFWGFNGIDTNGAFFVDPLYNDTLTGDAGCLPDDLQAERLPAIAFTDSAHNAETNQNGYCTTPNAVKDLFSGTNTAFYTQYNGGGNTDPYDPCYQTWLTSWAAANLPSPPSPWTMGVELFEQDHTIGYRVSNVAVDVLAANQFQTYGGNTGGALVFNDRQFYAKSALSTFLQGRYASISALNTAWGSTYDTFNSDGTNRTQTIGTGDGATLTFSATLSFTPDHGSVWVKVGSSVVAGVNDCCVVSPANLVGATVASGTVNFSTKAITITFSMGNAPGNGVLVTADYYSGGWGTGSGLLDEDGRHGWMPSSSSCWETISVCLGTTMQADMNAFLSAYATKFFSLQNAAVKGRSSNYLYLGANGWVAEYNQVYQAATPYFDGWSGAWNQMTQGLGDSIVANFGDKPLYNGSYLSASVNDSDYASGQVTSSAGLTQKDKGIAYQTFEDANVAYTVGAGAGIPSAVGTKSFFGNSFWSFTSKAADATDFGLVSRTDNAYDGFESLSYGCSHATPASCGSCVNTFGFVCGAESTYARTGFLIGTGDGSTTAFSTTIGFLPIQPSTVAINAGTFSTASQATDAFQRVDANPLSGSWATANALSALQLVSHNVEGTGNTNGATNTGVTWSNFNDQYSKITVGAAPSGKAVGAMVRWFGGGVPLGYDCDVLGPLGASATLRIVENSSTVLTSGTFTVNSGDTIECDVLGSTITLRLNGTNKLTAVNSDRSSGLAGMIIYDSTTSSQITAWDGGSVTATNDCTDNGLGVISGAGCSSGTVNYATGAISVTRNAAPASGVPVSASFTQGGWGGLQPSAVAGVQAENWKVLHNEEVALFSPAPFTTNLALLKPTAASSMISSSRYAIGLPYLPSRANDGDTATTWQPAASDPQWLRVDMQNVNTSMGKVILRWGAVWGTAYTIDTSNDGIAWTTRFTQAAGTGGVETDTFTPVSARYIRVNETARSGAGSLVLQEFEVYPN